MDIKGRHSVTGCVATAMAQAMNYYHYPSQTKGSTIRYKAPSLGCYESFNYSTYSINWNNIKDTYDESSTETQKQEVAQLMHACGVSVYMDYDSISNADPRNIPYALINNFGFNANTYFVDRDYYDVKEWHEMMRKELQAKRPILYGGHGMGGHRFIIDGINSQGLYHINFGWDGGRDGWFSIDAIHPYGDLLALLRNAHFNNDQSMVIGVSKETIDESQDVFYVDKIKLDTLAYINTNTIIGCDEDSYYFCYGNKVNSQVKDTYTIGVGVFDENWQLLKYLDRYTYSFRIGLGIKRNFSVKYDAATFTEGSQYYIALYAQHRDNPKPTLIRTQYGKQDWYRATTKGGKVYLERKLLIETTPDPKPVHQVIPEGPIGNFIVYASDRSDNGVTWQVVCIKDTEDSTKYYIKGLDPTLSKEAVSNTAHGFMKVGDFMRIPRQNIGGDFYLENYSADDSITLEIQRQDSVITEMKILNAWGIVKRTVNSQGQTEQNNLSTYSKTTFKPGIIPGPPSIFVDDNKKLIISYEEGAAVYYTLDGTKPSASSSRYTEPVPMTKNCTIKAIAIKGEEASEVAEYKLNIFKVTTPEIKALDETTIRIDTETLNATIYYTVDGNEPTVKDGLLYTEPFSCLTSATIKAFAVRDGWNTSDVAKYDHIVPPDTIDIIVTDNVAGGLGTRISASEKLTATSLKVSGKLNGTDIKFIREMITDGCLNHVDLGKADIVSGGEPYFTYSSGSAYSTEDNVIGTNMFAYLDGLLSLVLPESATNIEHAFYETNSLKEIKIPNGCTSLGQVITFCDALQTVYIPASVTKIATNNFFACPNMKAINVDENNELYCSVEGVVFSKDKTTIVRYPTSHNDTFIIPNGVRTIGEDAFYDTDVKSVEIPVSVTSILSSAFNDCNNLETITIPNSVKRIGRAAFEDCSNLNSIILSDDLEEIESSLFIRCHSLRMLHLGKKIHKIASNAFNYCESLQRFTVDSDNSVYSADDGILVDKDGKRIVRCPEGLFVDEMHVSDNVQEIGDNAFMRCENIRIFIMPDSLKTIGKNAFDGCMIEMFDIPDGVTTIGSEAFCDCDMLRTAVIPAATLKIPDGAYLRCYKLNYVKIHKDVDTIGSSSFRFCHNLNNIHSEITNIDSVVVENLAFDGISETCTWCVPSGPENDIEKYARRYKAQPWWVSTWQVIIDENVEESQTITFADASMRTFCSESPLDFKEIEGLSAYIASGFSAETGDVIMSKVEKIPAETGLILIGETGKSYNVPIKETDYLYSNLLIGVLEDTEIDKGFLFNGNLFDAVNAPQMLKAGEAYLNIAIENAKRLNIRFTDTDEVESVKSSVNASETWYTLQGTRLNQKPTQHGIYLHQGKKVMVK